MTTAWWFRGRRGKKKGRIGQFEYLANLTYVDTGKKKSGGLESESCGELKKKRKKSYPSHHYEMQQGEGSSKAGSILCRTNSRVVPFSINLSKGEKKKKATSVKRHIVAGSLESIGEREEGGGKDHLIFLSSSHKRGGGKKRKRGIRWMGRADCVVFPEEARGRKRGEERERKLTHPSF